jgi:hypothetical protein
MQNYEETLFFYDKHEKFFCYMYFFLHLDRDVNGKVTFICFRNNHGNETCFEGQKL